MRLAVLLVFLAGCVGWHEEREPMRDVRTHEVADVQGICTRIVGKTDLWLGCAWWNKDLSSCDIFVSRGAPDFVLAHERRHCAGEEHL